jgi:uncharacterized oxidoreductase
MILTGNTIFITGGGSGIGRGLAEALHKRGNQIIISGRRRSHLEATTKANPGMASVELDLQDPKSIASVAKKLIAQYPKLNVLINNAGIMQIDDAAGVIDDALLVASVNTNLLGTIRVTSALIEHLKKQPSATIIYNTSVLGYVPLAITAVYSSTKAALHSYVLSQRYKLKNTAVRVLEIAPPWVQTDLLGSNARRIHQGDHGRSGDGCAGSLGGAGEASPRQPGSERRRARHAVQRFDVAATAPKGDCCLTLD